MKISCSNSIKFSHLVANRGLKHRTELKNYIVKVLVKNHVYVSSIVYIFCSDEFLLKMNQKFLKHDTYTDILTFKLSKKKEPLYAEIYISIDRVSNNAHTLKQSFHIELHRVIFHGLLHLLGFEDKTSPQKAKMTAKEDLLLKRYFVSREIDALNLNKFPAKP